MSRNVSGRGVEIRTPDLLRPRQARYQAALRPDNKCVFIIRDCQRGCSSNCVTHWSARRRVCLGDERTSYVPVDPRLEDPHVAVGSAARTPPSSTMA